MATQLPGQTGMRRLTQQGMFAAVVVSMLMWVCAVFAFNQAWRIYVQGDGAAEPASLASRATLDEQLDQPCEAALPRLQALTVGETPSQGSPDEHPARPGPVASDTCADGRGL